MLPNIGLSLVANAFGLGIQGADFMSLYTTPVTVTDATNLASLGTVASFPGYAPHHPGFPRVVSGTGNTLASYSIPPVTFACTGGGAPQTVWSAVYQFVGSAPFNDLVVAWNLPNGPQVVSQAGDSIITQLTMTFQRAPGQP